MAVMIRRLSLAALVLVAMLIPVLRSGKPPEPGASERRLARLQALRSRQDVAGARWGALAERDSGAIPAARHARPGRPSIQLRGFGAALPAPGPVTIVNDLWTRLGPVDSTVRVALLLYNADRYRLPQQRWWSYAGSSISLGDAGATCVAFLPGIPQKDGAIGAGREKIESALAPCLLLAGFGPPGSALRGWLLNTRFAAAGSAAWLTRTRSFIDGGRGVAPPWMGYPYWYEGGRLPDRGLLSISRTARAVAEMLSPPYELGAYGLRCTEGDITACRTGVLDSALISGSTRGLPADLVYAPALLDRPPVRSLGAPRPPGDWWLSDLIRDQGREKFARFWKSPASFEQAFQEAFGEDLGAWTHRWSVRQWENSWYEKYRHTPRVLGATLEPSWPLLTLGWTAAVLVLTGWVARRRQVT